MIGSWYLLVPVLLPILSGLAVAFVRPLKEFRTHKPFTAAILTLNILALLPILFSGSMELELFRISDDLPVLLRTDSLGLFFAAVMALVWCLAGFYSFGYMVHEGHLSRYYSFYLATLGVLMALCFAGSIVTFYMCYELMTLLTVPLVMHTMKKDAVAAGIKYLIYSVAGASLVLLGTFLLSPYVTSFSFAPAGVLDTEKIAGHEKMLLAASFLMLLGFGTKAGMFPMHGWLPTAHPAAPAPASAVLSGIITKAGVLGELRLIFCFIGPDALRGTWVQVTFMCLALFTVFMGSMLAYREDVLKKRLAYSSVSQVSYILFGISTLHPLGLIGALLHVAAHALIKNTLFMSAGAVIHQTEQTRVSQLRGIGKQMPATMWCFTLAAVGLVGIPPCLGFVSKWYLAQGSLAGSMIPDVLRYLGPVILLISALLTAGYLLSITLRGFFPGKDDAHAAPLPNTEAGMIMVIPMVVLTALMLVLGMFPGALMDLFTGITAAFFA